MTSERAEIIKRFDAQMQNIGGCTDGGCVVVKPKGMHTNGGCKCMSYKLKAQRMAHAAIELRAAIESKAVAGEAVELEYPEFHEQGMGCGLEDRGITDRYEAMRYGFDEALDQMAAILDGLGPLYTTPQPAPLNTIRVDIENVGICDIPVRDGVAYMPEITVADIVRRAQPAPVDAEVERDAQRYRFLRDRNGRDDEGVSVQIFIDDEAHGPGHLDAQIDAALAAQQKGLS